MELFEAIEKRHSYRGEYTADKVSRDDLKKIVQTGIQAPSGCNKQSTSFVIVDDGEVMKQIADILEKPSVAAAPALIACVIDKTPAFEGMEFSLEDCAASVENMLLAITALGYATVWLDGVLRRNGCAEKIAKLLNVPENLTLEVVLPIGVPVTQEKQRERKTFDERAWFNTYGSVS